MSAFEDFTPEMSPLFPKGILFSQLTSRVDVSPMSLFFLKNCPNFPENAQIGWVRKFLVAMRDKRKKDAGNPILSGFPASHNFLVILTYSAIVFST